MQVNSCTSQNVLPSPQWVNIPVISTEQLQETQGWQQGWLRGCLPDALRRHSLLSRDPGREGGPAALGAVLWVQVGMGFCSVEFL